MTQKTKNIWLVGASTGIGRALAIKLARQGNNVYATARDENALKEMAGIDAQIIPMPGDVTDLPRMREIVGAIGQVDIAILNAGYYKPDPIETFTYDEFEKHVRVNLLGVGACLDAILPGMRDRGDGHIAITASVAGYHGLPRSLSYGPTKAAQINLAEALAIETKGTDIKVQVINPGFVKTRLTEQNDFPMPFLLETEEAADYIMKGLEKDRFEITFPWLFSRMLRRIAALPYALSIPIISKTKK